MLSASLLVLLASCQKSEVVETKISLSPEKVMQVDLAAQTVSVTIESGSKWTLSGEYDWVTPSATSGKSGDKVTFTLALNTTGKIRAAVYEIKADNLTEQLVIKQIGSKIDVNMTLAVADYSDNYVTVAFNLDADDLNLFSSWGLCYSETENPEEGTDIVFEGAPVNGAKDFTISNLVTDQTYNVWGWLENEDGVRIYNDTKLEATAKAFELVFTSPNLFSREFKTKMTVPMPCVELGVCWNEAGSPTVDDDHMCQTEVTTLDIELSSASAGYVMKPQTTYKMRPYIIKNNSETAALFASVGDVEVMATPEAMVVEVVADNSTHKAEFIGTYTTVKIDALMEDGIYDILFFGNDGQLYYLSSGITSKVVNIKPFRAYIRLPKGAINWSDGQQAIARHGEGTTSIDNAPLTNDNASVIYDLQGRRVEKIGKGIYIVNGKKVFK